MLAVATGEALLEQVRRIVTDGESGGRVDVFWLSVSASEISMRCTVMFSALRELKASSIVQLIEQ